MRPFRDAGGSLIDLFIFLLYISFFALLFYLLFAGLVLAKVVIGDTGGGGGGDMRFVCMKNSLVRTSTFSRLFLL